jgi:hypothetical protein
MSITASTLIVRTTSASAQAQDSVHAAAGRLYNAECAFHDARQTHVDAWILAASDRLHCAIATHSAAVAASLALTA